MAGKGGRPKPEALPGLRLDKWLFQARFFRSRSLAAEVIEAGHCRVNGARVTKVGHDVRPGDTLTFAQGSRIRLIRVLDLGQRRGPAAEAQALYRDMDAEAGDAAAPQPLE